MFKNRNCSNVFPKVRFPAAKMGLPVLAAVLFCILLPSASAQMNWALEGSFPSYGEFNSADPFCLVGTAPYALFLPPAPPPPCHPLIPFNYGDCRLGGSAFDDDGNSFSGGTAFPAMLHTDGKVVQMTDAATGAFILSMDVGGIILPGPISGLGYDSLNDICWVTDSVNCAGINLVYCGTPTVAIGPFALPLIGGAPATGLDWDPCTDTLWFCDCDGNLVNCDTSGTLISWFYTVLPLGDQHTGLDINVTNGNIQVTEGGNVGEFTPAGGLATPGAFYLKNNPYVIPVWTAKVNGLAFSLRPQKYGQGCWPAGSGPVSIEYSGGYPFAGNAGFTVYETGATPGSQAYLIYGFDESCPPVPITGCPGAGLWIFPFSGPIPLGIVPASGITGLSIPLPGSGGNCGFPVGISLRFQFINVIATTPLQLELSNALSFTIGER